MKMKLLKREEIFGELAPISKRRAETLIDPEVGQLDPIKVYKNGDGLYHIINGRGRWLEAEMVGLEELWCIVEDRPSAERVAIEALGDLAVRDNPMEDAKQLEFLLSLEDDNGKPKYTQQSLARKLAIDQSQISQRIKLLNLIEDLQTRVYIGKGQPEGIAPRTGYYLASLPPEEQEKLINVNPLTIKIAKELADKQKSVDLGLADLEVPEMEPGLGFFVDNDQARALLAGEEIEIAGIGNLKVV